MFPPKTITFSISNVIVAITSWFVGFVVLYVIVAFGKVFFNQSTLAIAVPLFPALSSNSNVYSPLSSNTCVFPSFTVTSSSLKVIVAVTFWLVGVVIS